MLDTVLEGVFEQRLKQHCGDCSVERVFGDFPRDRDARSEARAHDVRVELEQLYLLAQRGELSRAGLKAGAQQVRELCEQRVGASDVDMHQRRDGIQRVEQEMWLQLCLELRELRLGEMSLQRQHPIALLLPPSEAGEAEQDRQPQAHIQKQLDSLVEKHLRPRVVTVSDFRERVDAVANAVDPSDEGDDDSREPRQMSYEPA